MTYENKLLNIDKIKRKGKIWSNYKNKLSN